MHIGVNLESAGGSGQSQHTAHQDAAPWSHGVPLSKLLLRTKTLLVLAGMGSVPVFAVLTQQQHRQTLSLKRVFGFHCLSDIIISIIGGLIDVPSLGWFCEQSPCMACADGLHAQPHCKYMGCPILRSAHPSSIKAPSLTCYGIFHNITRLLSSILHRSFSKD